MGKISSNTADVENVAAVAWRVYLAKNLDRLGDVVKHDEYSLRVGRRLLTSLQI